MRVKKAELWLEVNQPSKAMCELGHLSSKARAHGWASQVMTAAARTITETVKAG